MAECTSCGARIDYRDKFCSSCGALTAAGRPIAHQIGKAVADAATEIAKLAEQFASFVRDEGNRKQVIIGGSALALLLVVLTDNPIANGVSGLFGSEPAAPQFTADGQPDFANYEDVFFGEDAQVVVTGTANVRNYPTSQGTEVVDRLAEGAVVSARRVQAFDPTADWHKLSSGGYIWGGNLSRASETQSAQGPAFSPHLRGRWSLMDTCRGADIEDFYLVISTREIQFYESGGLLVRISRDYKQRELYHVAMSGEGQSWDETFRFILSEDSMAVTVFDDDGFHPMAIYYKPGVSCARVAADDKRRPR